MLSPRMSAGVFLLQSSERRRYVLSSREQKKQVVAEISTNLQKAQSVVFVNYSGLNVSKITELRAKLRQVGAEMKVVKNTLARRAVADCGLEGLAPYLDGPTASVFSNLDPVSGPQVLKEFAKKNKRLIIKGGALENKALDAEGVRALADLPSRDELLTQVVWGMQGLIVGLVNVLQGPQRKFVYAVEALRQEKEN